MQTVTVSKKDLLTRLQENGKKHVAEYEVAIVAYRASVREWMEEQIGLIDDSGEFSVWFNEEPEPENHGSDYDTAIEMIEWSEDNQISLTQHEFKQYVQDDWQWQAAFKESATYYNTKMGVMR